jgi:NADPH:quinone reductase-like Zn-dependent oxidoreductase
MTSQEQHASASHGAAGTARTMRAIVQDAYGSAEVLRMARIPRPTPAENEVLIRVRAAGLDRGTWHLTTGTPYLLRVVFGIRRPRNRVPGRDLAGTVVGVGAGVERFRVGEEVFGIGLGSFAEYAVAREEKIARKPETLTFEQAAAVSISGLTALQGLRDVGRIQRGQKVLILGASGGVGSFAVQLAKAFGTEVTGVCSTTKLDLVRSLGADHVLDYTRDDFANGTHRYDLILDIAGNPALSRLRRALMPTGTAVIVGGEDGGKWTGSIDRQYRALALSLFTRQRLTFVVSKEAGDLETLAGLLEAGTLTPSIDMSFPLDQVPEAMRYFDAGRARGKVAITV